MRRALPGKMMIMSSGERAVGDHKRRAEPEAAAGEGSSGKRRISAMAAVVALATVAGALGGALATAVSDIYRRPVTFWRPSNNLMLEASVARIDADIVALKAGVEHTSKVGNVSQFNKTSDRLDKVEKAQAEPAAKLARLSEAVEKLRAQRRQRRAGCRCRAGSANQGCHRLDCAAGHGCCSSAGSAATRQSPKLARLPTVEGWVLRDVEQWRRADRGPPGHSKSMPAIPSPASAGSTPSASRTANGWS